MTDPDQQFFADHPDRWAHIRKPRMVLERQVNHVMKYVDEMRGEFWKMASRKFGFSYSIMEPYDFDDVPVLVGKKLF